VQTDDEFSQVKKNLHVFQSFLASRPDIQHYLTTPFLPSKRRLDIAHEILKKSLPSPFSPKNVHSPSAKTARFILLLVENERLVILPEILEALPLIWNEEHDISTFEITSVVPLTSSQKERLEHQLFQLEGRKVSLRYAIDSSLIGGISVRRDNIIYDMSIAGSLSRMKEKITEG
jgi:F-type H+-transporting ATPase subunit delta